MCLHTRFLNVLFHKLDIDSAIRRLVSRSFCRIRVACAIKKKKRLQKLRERSRHCYGWTEGRHWAPRRLFEDERSCRDETRRFQGNLFVEWNEPMNEWMKGGKAATEQEDEIEHNHKHHNKSKTQCRQNLQKHKTTKKKKLQLLPSSCRTADNHYFQVFCRLLCGLID